ncbi:MAG: YhgE/Pip family protein, partial [Varibaculum cambriense]|nr:YhgE/Pip family protein [Varibaculum cambriense]
EQLKTLLDKQIAGFQQTRDALERALGPDGADLEGKDPAVDRLLAEMDAAIARQQILSERLGSIASDLRRGVTVDSDLRKNARQAIADAQKAIATARSNFEKNLQPKIESLRKNLDSAGKNVKIFRSYLQAVQTDLSESAGGMIASMRRSQKTLDNTAKKMRDGARRLDQARKQISSAQSQGDLKKIATTLGADPKDFARLISSPIAVKRNAVFPVVTFGVGMTPLFTVIALWVGALLAGVFLRTDVSENVGKRYLASRGARKDPDATAGADANAEESSRLEGADTEASEAESTPEAKTAAKAAGKKPVFTGAQEYLGRYFMFWVIGMAQSTLLMVGLIVFVEIKPAHPFLLILAGWVISTVFTVIVYTLVVALANAGKALAVLLLVLQISAAGGAYPLELLPQWFQNIIPWLPATYAINLMRSAIAGIYAGDYAYNLVILLVFLIPNLVLGLVLRRTIAGRIHDMAKEVEKTKVM